MLRVIQKIVQVSDTHVVDPIRDIASISSLHIPEKHLASTSLYAKAHVQLDELIALARSKVLPDLPVSCKLQSLIDDLLKIQQEQGADYEVTKLDTTNTIAFLIVVKK